MWGMPEGRGKKHKVLEPPGAIMMETAMIRLSPEWDYPQDVIPLISQELSQEVGILASENGFSARLFIPARFLFLPFLVKQEQARSCQSFYPGK